MALDERVQLRRTVAGRELYAKVAERDSDGYNIAESFELINDKIPASASVNNKLATSSDLSGKQDTLSFDPNSQYDASNNPVATVGTVTGATSTKEDTSNKVTAIRDTSTATDTAYPSEKAVATALAGLSGCTVTYVQGTGELQLDFRPGN